MHDTTVLQPDSAVSMFSLFEAASSVSDRLLSLDCALNTASGAKSLFYSKLVIFMASPPILVVGFAVFWIAMFHYRRNHDSPLSKKRVKDLFTVSCVVTVVLIHPTITRQIFSLFSCTQVGVGGDVDVQ